MAVRVSYAGKKKAYLRGELMKKQETLAARCKLSVVGAPRCVSVRITSKLRVSVNGLEYRLRRWATEL